MYINNYGGSKMKELSIEEKAKRYDEALARARNLYKDAIDMEENIRAKQCAIIFPELKISEDEKIRKQIISFLKEFEYDHYRCLDFSSWIAWLEKQGNNANKVESIFEVGKWIVANESKYTFLLKRGAPRFQAENTNGDIYSFYLLPNGEEEYHLWTIEDAKDGDVLVYGDNPNHNHVEVIMLFKSLRSECSANTHFHIFNDQFRNDDWCDCGKNVHPATKEQRDLLFQKMKEAGYEWDAENKELKKIEQTIEIPFGAKDSELQEATYYIPDGYHAEINGNEVVIKKGEIKSCKI